MTPAQLAKNGLIGPAGVFGANLELANGTDADHDIDIGIGSCVDSTGVYKMGLFAALTKQIDAAWAAGTNAGGMFTGAVANDTWYHVHLIRNDITGASQVFTNTASQIIHGRLTDNVTCWLSTNGWIDPRGKVAA